MAEIFVNSKKNKNDCNVEYCSGMGNKEKVLELLHTDCRISLMLVNHTKIPIIHDGK